MIYCTYNKDLVGPVKHCNQLRVPEYPKTLSRTEYSHRICSTKMETPMCEPLQTCEKEWSWSGVSHATVFQIQIEGNKMMATSTRYLRSVPPSLAFTVQRRTSSY